MADNPYVQAPKTPTPLSPQSALRKRDDVPEIFDDPSAPQKIAILSVYDKTGLLDLAKILIMRNVKLYGSGGTAAMVREAGFPISDVSDITKAPEILGGRVKTLHPSVHGGILARDIDSDQRDLDELGIEKVDFVVCNLYPFKETVAKPFVKIEEAVEEIDIGGVTLLRAAAKNHSRVTVLSDPNDYPTFLEEFRKGDISQETRNQLALKAFLQTADYDMAIADFFRKKYGHGTKQLTLRYGVNPHQIPAQAYVREGDLPFKVLNGAPGYINLLDALYSWPLVKELTLALDMPAAASFKHVSPAGAAVGIPLTEDEKKVYFAEDIDDKSALAAAYARARGADRMSSFGDWIALSHKCDVATAKLIQKEVSDGIVAPDYDPAALEILSKKKGGKYTVLQIDPAYTPGPIEVRQVYGVTLQQQRNDVKIDAGTFGNIVSKNKDLIENESAMMDLIVATIALKYTQSNSVCYAKKGMVVGIGAGQQSRIHCTRLAGDKTDAWWLRFHPRVLAFDFKKETKRPDKANVIDLYVNDKIPDTASEREQYESVFNTVPDPLTPEERADFLKQLENVACSSDAFFPFPDNVHRLAKSGVKYVAAPGGSVQDKIVHETADSYNMVYVDTGIRLFTH